MKKKQVQLLEMEKKNKLNYSRPCRRNCEWEDVIQFTQNSIYKDIEMKNKRLRNMASRVRSPVNVEYEFEEEMEELIDG